MNMLTDSDVGELFATIKKETKAASEALQSGDTDKVVGHLNKVNVTANYGQAALFYKATMGDENNG